MKTRSVEEVKAGDLSEFMQEVVRPPGLGRPVLYRGQAADWPLLPSLLRGDRLANSEFDHWEALYQASMKQFQHHARPHLRHEPATALEWNCEAAQFGAPSTFSQWTRNGLAAVFHATDPSIGEDGVVWRILPRDESLVVESDPDRLPQGIQLYHAHRTEPVAAAHETAFLSHVLPELDTPAMPLDELWACTPEFRVSLTKIVVPVAMKSAFREMLMGTGTHHARLFPDAHGVGRLLDESTGYHTTSYDWIYDEVA